MTRKEISFDPSVLPSIEQQRTGEDSPPPDLEQMSRVRSALGCLSPREAQVVDLKFWAQMTDREAAIELGLTTATVSGTWKSAKLKLERRLAGLTPTPFPDTSTSDGEGSTTSWLPGESGSPPSD